MVFKGVAAAKLSPAFQNYYEGFIKAHLFIIQPFYAQTLTGVLKDAQALCKLAKEYDCLTTVDAVTSLGGCKLKIDDWQIDGIYSGTQKCLSCLPGLSPVSFSPKAIDTIKASKSPVRCWFLDMDLVLGYWGKRAYHYTTPVNCL